MSKDPGPGGMRLRARRRSNLSFAETFKVALSATPTSGC